MRMGAFLMGGVLGAAAVVYLQKNRGNMMMSTMSSASNPIGKIIDKGMAAAGMSDFTGKNTSWSSDSQSFSGAKNTSASTSKSSSASSFTSKDGLDKVEDIVKQDPSLKSKVDEILEENNQKSAAYQSH